MGFMDDVSRKVKAKAEEWDVQGKADKFAAEVDKVAHEAKDKAATYADENRHKVATGLDKAGAKIDERTEGKYSDKIGKAKEQVAKGVDRLAEQRPGGPQAQQAPGATPTSAPTPAAGSPWATATDAPAGPTGPTPQDSYRPDSYPPEPYRADPIDRAAPIDEAAPTEVDTGWPHEPAPTKPTGEQG
jgi:uncharacterized protein YjbJ (UPF0337 family)